MDGVWWMVQIALNMMRGIPAPTSSVHSAAKWYPDTDTDTDRPEEAEEAEAVGGKGQRGQRGESEEKRGEKGKGLSASAALEALNREPKKER